MESCIYVLFVSTKLCVQCRETLIIYYTFPSTTLVECMYVDSSLKREAKFLDIQSIGGRVTYDPRQKINEFNYCYKVYYSYICIYFNQWRS
jgi:hypothetical protein